MLVRVLVSMLVVVGLTPSQSMGAEPVPAGLDFQVNTFTTSNQDQVGVAAYGEGQFVLVWTSDKTGGTDVSGSSIKGQRYDAGGIPKGAEFQVNTYTTNRQEGAAVARAGTGFVVLWGSLGSGDSDVGGTFSIQGQRYDADGTPQGAQFQVNTYTTGNQAEPSVAADGFGNFVVVWSSLGSGESDNLSGSIQGRRYDATGAPQGAQFQVNTYTTGSQFAPDVAADGTGRFVVIWSSFGSPGSDVSGASIQGQRYDADGTPRGAQFQANTYTTSGQFDPAVAAEKNGSFMVVWGTYDGEGSDTDYASIQGQRYDAAGTLQGAQFQVNTHTTGSQYGADVSADGSSNFVVVWSSLRFIPGTDSREEASIQGQRYAADGTPLGAQFQVNSNVTGFEVLPVVATNGPNGAGDFVVAWSDYLYGYQDGDLGGIFARRFVEPTTTTTTSSTSTSTTSSTSSTGNVPTVTSTSSTSTSTALPGSCARADEEGAGCDDGDPCTVDDVCAAGACKGQLLCTVAPTPPAPVPANQGVSVEVSAEPGATVEAALFEVPLDEASAWLGLVVTPQAEDVGEPLSKSKTKKVKRKGRVVLKLKLNKRGREKLKSAPNGVLRVVVRTTVRVSGREAVVTRLLNLLRKRS